MSSLQMGWQAERGEQPWVRETGDLDDAVAVDGQDHDPVGGAAAAVVVAAVGRDRWLKVGPGGDQDDLADAAAGRDGAQELADGVMAAVGGWDWRHGEQRVLAQQ